MPASKAIPEISPGARLVSDLPERDRKLQPGVKLVPLAGDAWGKWIKVQPKTAASVHRSRHAKPVFNDAGTPVWGDSSLADAAATATAIVTAWKRFPLSILKCHMPGRGFPRCVSERRVREEECGEHCERRQGTSLVLHDDRHQGRRHVRWMGARAGSSARANVRSVGLTGFRTDRQQQHHADRHAQALHPRRRAVSDRPRQTEFETSAATVNAISKREKAIDANRDGNVTAHVGYLSPLAVTSRRRRRRATWCSSPCQPRPMARLP